MEIFLKKYGGWENYVVTDESENQCKKRSIQRNNFQKSLQKIFIIKPTSVHINFRFQP